MKLRILFLTILTTTFLNCKSTASVAEIENLKKIALDKNFTITADTANPVALMNTRGIESLLPPGSNLANINLINNQNNFTIKNDSVFLDMPFYGERRFSSGYGTESGLEFEGVPEKVESSFNKKKRSTHITRQKRYTYTYTYIYMCIYTYIYILECTRA